MVGHIFIVVVCCKRLRKISHSDSNCRFRNRIVYLGGHERRQCYAGRFRTQCDRCAQTFHAGNVHPSVVRSRMGSSFCDAFHLLEGITTGSFNYGKRGKEMKKHVAISMLVSVLLAAANAVESKPKHVFIRDSACDGQVSSTMMAALRQEIRASAGYQLATSLSDTGGHDVVITVYVVCVEGTLPTNSEHVVSMATIFGTGTCTFGSCNVTSNESSMGAWLCSGHQGSSCGKDIYTTLDQYMSKDGGRIFDDLSKERIKSMGVQP